MAVSPWPLNDHDKGPAPEDEGGRELTFRIPRCYPFSPKSQPLSPTPPLSICGARL